MKKKHGRIVKPSEAIQAKAPLPDVSAADSLALAAQAARRRMVVVVLVVLLVVGVSAAIFFAFLTSTTGGPNPIVVMETSMGTVKIELFESKAPITVKNFLAYTEDKFYDGTIFHRVIPNFMIQGGGFLPGAREKFDTRKPIRNESHNGLRNERGTLAMARTGDPDSATAQFFINVKDNDFLDRANAKDRVGYCVFGRVLEGMDVVDKIRAVPTSRRGPHDDVPIEDVIIRSIRRAD